jgi:hypothetical protein
MGEAKQKLFFSSYSICIIILDRTVAHHDDTDVSIIIGPLPKTM